LKNEHVLEAHAQGWTELHAAASSDADVITSWFGLRALATGVGFQLLVEALKKKRKRKSKTLCRKKEKLKIMMSVVSDRLPKEESRLATECKAHVSGDNKLERYTMPTAGEKADAWSTNWR